jgi:hypothetical protein
MVSPNLGRCDSKGKREISFMHPWTPKENIANGLRALARSLSPSMIHYANQEHDEKLA